MSGPITHPTSENRTFAVIVHSKEMLAYDKSIMTRQMSDSG